MKTAKENAKRTVLILLQDQLRQIKVEIEVAQRNINNLSEQQAVRKRSRNELCKLIREYTVAAKLKAV